MKQRWWMVIGTAAFVCGGCQSASIRLPKEVIDLSRHTMTGGELVIEVDDGGKLINADAQVEISSVPDEVKQAADRELPGPIVRAEREIAEGHLHLWEVEKRVSGRSVQLLFESGKLIGKEEELARSAWPENVVRAVNEAVPEGRITTIERVTGPEALGGAEYHVKKDVGGELLRISVLDNGKVTRKIRKLKAEFRVPR